MDKITEEDKVFIKNRVDSFKEEEKEEEEKGIDNYWLKTEACYLYRNTTDNHLAILIVSKDGEELDNHCEECIEQPPMWFRMYWEDKYIAYSAVIGNTKMNKILDNKIQMDQYKLLHKVY